MVFTKCGLIWDPNNPMAPPQRVLKPESIRQECDASLRRLGVERIDLYQFHWPDENGTPIEDSWNEMVRLIKEGKVRRQLPGCWPGPALLYWSHCWQPLTPASRRLDRGRVARTEHRRFAGDFRCHRAFRRRRRADVAAIGACRCLALAG
jgi:hypothetical protein